MDNYNYDSSFNIRLYLFWTGDSKIRIWKGVLDNWYATEIKKETYKHGYDNNSNVIFETYSK